MTTSIPVALQNAISDLAADAVDAGAAAGYVEIREGVRPATPADAATGTLIVTLTLNDPAYGAAAAGVALLDIDPVPSATAVADGTPGWYRVYDSNGVVAHDGEFATAGAIVTGQTVEIDAGGDNQLETPAESA